MNWLDEDEMRAWRGLVDVYADVEASLGAELAENHGISSGDYAVLVALSEAEAHRLRMPTPNSTSCSRVAVPAAMAPMNGCLIIDKSLATASSTNVVQNSSGPIAN